MANRIVINKSVSLNGCIVEVLGCYGESRLSAPALCSLSEYKARITVAYLGGELSSDDYQALVNHYEDWKRYGK
ncbi:hypothetical protein PQC44_gp098 [Escherichia phage IME267]|uniref:Uncharacterized protein n=1 Tax=Escherichia phage IME267 TaxID=2860374 RepID=A0AAE7WE89_9CAUD|nr:hypothetical protein PQC44_gp098 [Escherichia phage IME267]QYC96996.1 hypothetical protein [Escherichia phage IME267]